MIGLVGIISLVALTETGSHIRQLYTQVGGAVSPGDPATPAASLVPDTSGPVLLTATSTASGSMVVGQAIDIVVTWDEAVLVTGNPYIDLDFGGSPRQASYSTGSGSTALTFSYTIDEGDETSTGVDVGSPIQANAGSLKDAAGNDAQRIFAPFSLGSVAVTCTNLSAPRIFTFTTPQSEFLWPIPCGTTTIDVEVWGAGGAGGALAGGGGGGAGGDNSATDGVDGEKITGFCSTCEGEESRVETPAGAVLARAFGGDYGTGGEDGDNGKGVAVGTHGFGGSSSAGGGGGSGNATTAFSSHASVTVVAAIDGADGSAGTGGAAGAQASAIGGAAGTGGTGGTAHTSQRNAASGAGAGGDGGSGGSGAGNGGGGGQGFPFNGGSGGGGGAGGGGEAGGYVYLTGYNGFSPGDSLRIEIGKGGTPDEYPSGNLSGGAGGVGLANGQAGADGAFGEFGANGRVVVIVNP